MLWRVISGQSRRVGAASLLGALHQAGEALVPVLIGVIIDSAVATGDGWGLARWIVVLAVLFLVLSLSFRFELRLMESASERAAHQVRMDLTARVLHSGGFAARDRLSGELTSIATGDAKRVGAVNLALPVAFAAVSGLVVGAIALLRVSVPLGLLILVVAPLMLALAHLMGKPLERRSEAEQERAAQASGIAADLVSGLRALKGIGAESTAAARYRVTSRGSLFAAVRAARAQSWLEGSMLTLTGLFLAVIALVGGKLAVSGEITVGQLVAAVGLAQFLLWPLSIFAWVNGLFAQGRASARRVSSVLSAPHAVSSGAALPAPVRGHVRLAAVSHGSLRSVDFSVEPGELLGVVVTDPADATALLSVLGRSADPDSGSVSLDGVCLSTVEPDEVHRSVVVAAHDADLFAGTVATNVVGSSVDQALTASSSLPLSTLVSERGRSLSGGQRQRVALARALALTPPVLVLHDPSTAVDAVTEVSLAAGIRAMRAGLTTIVVASSPALLGAADRVVLVSGGQVVASGSHADLVRDHSPYREAVLA